MIFVTVGTTPFDSLIKYIDTIETEEEFVFQISNNAKYIPKNNEYFKFIKNINDYYEKAELIITHAGAGSIYNLLEKNKKIIIVPNIDRMDKHQLDIANYMEKSSYALTCNSFCNLNDILKESKDFHFKPYKKDNFFKEKEILNLINEEYI